MQVLQSYFVDLLREYQILSGTYSAATLLISTTIGLSFNPLVTIAIVRVLLLVLLRNMNLCTYINRINIDL